MFCIFINNLEHVASVSAFSNHHPLSHEHSRMLAKGLGSREHLGNNSKNQDKFATLPKKTYFGQDSWRKKTPNVNKTSDPDIHHGL